MRVVIKVGTAALQDDLILGEFAKALRQLVSEGHQVILVHGSVINSASRTNGNGIQMPPPLAPLPKTECSTVAAGRFNQHLIACLGRVGVPAIGLFGGDGNVIAAKTAEAGAYSNGYILEVASVDPFWLDVVCRSGGVPVIANVALAADDS